MKKLIIRAIALYSFFGLTLVSCGKDASEPTSESTIESSVSSGTSDAVDTERYYVELEAEDEDLRLAQGIDNSGRTTGKIVTDRDLRVQLAVRRQGVSGISTQTIRLSRSRGESVMKYEGYIEIPRGTSSQVDIAGVVLGEWTGTGTAPLSTDEVVATVASGGYIQSVKSTKLSKRNGNTINVPIPFIANWTTTTLSQGKSVAYKLGNIRLLFKPSGAILRVKLTNTLSKPVTVAKVIVRTNAFVDQWRYSFSSGLVRTNSLLGGEPMPGIRLPLGEQTYTWTLDPVTLQPNSTSADWYYIPVMPTNATSGDRTIQFSVVGSDGVIYPNAFQTGAALREGTQGVTLKVKPAGLPGNKYPTDGVPDVYTAEPKRRFRGDWIKIGTNYPFSLHVARGQYYPPSVESLASIFPSKFVARSEAQVTHVDEKITFGGKTYTGLVSRYKFNSNKSVLVGERFVRKDGSKDLRMAYRYSFLPFNSSTLKIQMKYIGYASEELDQLLSKPDSWWNDSKVVYLQAKGYHEKTVVGGDSDKARYNVGGGSEGIYVTRSPSKPDDYHDKNHDVYVGIFTARFETMVGPRGSSASGKRRVATGGIGIVSIKVYSDLRPPLSHYAWEEYTMLYMND